MLIYKIIWFRLSICMYVPVQDGGQGGHVYTSSCLHQHFGRSSVVAAVVNAEKVDSLMDIIKCLGYIVCATQED